jgi:hypothetical protein
MSAVWKLESPQVQAVGQVVALRHVHVSYGEKPTAHLGYAVGSLESGQFVAVSMQTRVVPLQTLVKEYPENGPKMQKATDDLLTAAFALLRESGAIGAGAVE